MRLASQLFSSVARVRRRWYASHPATRRRLARPVISIGNLSVGGSGKTPLVAAVARLLIEMGERPAILSRGYKRRHSADNVVVVSDGASLQTDVAHAGDEPFMLARAVPAASVVVAARRYLAGQLAEAQLGCTVHVLDDGFQHLQLARDINLLIVTNDDVQDPHTMPAGRLREPLSAAAAADAIVVWAREPLDPAEVAARLGVLQSFRMHQAIDTPRTLSESRPGADDRTRLQPPGPAFAIAGIARPERFFDDLRHAGWTLAGTRTFPDHHQFTSRDVADITAAADALKATVILMTEKDMVRLSESQLLQSPQPEARSLKPDVRSPRPEARSFKPDVRSLKPEARSPLWAWVPLHVTMDPAFASWLRDRLARAREDGDAAQRLGVQGPHKRSGFVGEGDPRSKQ